MAAQQDDEAASLADRTRRLVAAVRLLDAPSEVLRSAGEAVDVALALLEPHVVDGPIGATMAPGGRVERVPAAGRTSDPGMLFPYGPMVGPLNPIAPPLSFEKVGDRIVGGGTLGAVWGGPPGLVHGGSIALVFDELFTQTVVMNELGAMTGTLTVRYRRGTPIREPLELEGWVDRADGRKVFVRGEMRHRGVMTAEADGVFIRIGPERFTPEG